MLAVVEQSLKKIKTGKCNMGIVSFGVLWRPAPCFPVKGGTGHGITASFSLCLWLVTALGLCILDFWVQTGNDFIISCSFCVTTQQEVPW